MPWQDVMVQVDGGAAFDVARNFIQRWNHHRQHGDDVRVCDVFLEFSLSNGP